MKLTTVLLVVVFLGVSARSFSQSVTYKGINVSLEEIFSVIQRQTGYSFFYNNADIPQGAKVTVSLRNSSIKEALHQVLKDQGLKYAIKGETIFIIPFVVPSGAKKKSQPDRNVGGRVEDADGQPLQGVTISVLNTTIGTVTDKDGKFDLNVPADAVLKVSFLGYQTKEITVGDKAVINITLAASTTPLNQLVVVGYGTQKKATVTGAISTINAKQITTTTNENVENMLTGKLPGVRIVQKSSEPGAFDNSFDIRGFGSPLIVIDGIPRGNITRLDPNDIESISVLKDASAAIYGVRAANGVVLITTKQGKAGTLKLTYTGTAGVQHPSGLPHDVDAAEWMTLMNERQMHNVNGGTLAYSQDDIDAYKNGTKKSTNWFTPVINPYPLQTEHNLSASGGTDKATYYLSLGYLRQDGFWKSGDLNYERYNLRSNITSKITKGLTARLRLSAIMDQKNQPYQDAWNVFKSLWRQIPTQTVYANNNPDYLGNTLDGTNPLAMTSADISGYKKSNNKWLQSSFSLNYDIPFVTGLSVKGLYSYDYSMSTGKQYQKAFNLYNYDAATNTYVPTVSQSPSNLRRSFSESPSTLLQTSVRYDRNFNQTHHVSGLLLFEKSGNSGDNFYASRDLALEVDQLIAGSALNQQGYMNAGGLYRQTNEGIVGKFNYGYRSKYLAEFSFRYDGSSKFAPGRQWGFFPSVSLGWRVSEENFVKNNPSLSFIDNLKLRGSYGELGDDAASSYQFITGYTYPASGGNSQTLASGSVFDGSFVNAVGFTNLPNPDITWYTVDILDLGVDLDMWHGLLGVTADIFKRDRHGLLASRRLSLPSTLGASLPQENLNSDQTSGFEVELTHRNSIGDFNYSLSGNFAYTRTKWLNYDEAPAGNEYDDWRNHLDNRYNNIWWGNGYVGQYQSYQAITHSPTYVGMATLPGDYIYEDWNGDGIIDGSDNHPIATTGGVPQITYGFTLTAGYKGFDLNALFQGTAMVYVSYPEQLSQPLAWDGNALSQFLDRWHPVDPTADPYDPNTKWVSGYYAYTGTGSDQNSARDVQNASYLRLKSIEIGYTIPYSLTAKAGLKDVRIFVNGYNVFTVSQIRYVDPEHPSDVYGYIYPLNKSYNAGLSVTF